MGKRSKTIQELNLSEYKELKLKILRDDFGIHLTNEEVLHLKSLKTDIQVDQCAMAILNSRWE